MNAGIATVLRVTGSVLGVRGGFEGLANGRISPISLAGAAEHEHEAGTWLGSSRFPALAEPGVAERCRDALAGAALVVFGGNGSLAGARRLEAVGVRVALVPATIDNDVVGTEMTIGMASAVAYGAEAVERVRITARSLPGRAFVIQTLGGASGNLARAVAAASGVEDVLVPEVPMDLDAVAARLAGGERVVILGEGAGDAVSVAAALGARSGLRVHPTILGHGQRAARPVAADLALAARGGQAAVELLRAGGSGLVAL